MARPRASAPVWSSPSLACSFSSADAVWKLKEREAGSSCVRVAYPRATRLALSSATSWFALPLRQRPVCRRRPAQQQHRVVVHPIENIAAVDRVAARCQLGVYPAGAVDHGVRRAVRSCPIGQRPVLGDHVRELPPFHRRGVRVRLLRGRGRLLRTGHENEAAGDSYSHQDRRSGQQPPLPHHWRVTPSRPE